MKICFIAGANSTHSYRWINYFVQNGHDVDWISLGSKLKVKPEGFKFYLLKKGGPRILRPFSYLREIRRILKKNKPDILHVHQAWGSGLLGALSGTKPFVLTVWGSDVLIVPRNIIRRQLVKYTLRKADLITCDAEHVKKVMIGFGVPENKIKVINFGVETDRYCPGIKDDKLASILRVNGSPVIISLRSLREIYDVQSLVESVPDVLQEFPNAIFIIAGDGPLKPVLTNRAKELNITENIRFVGNVDSNKMPFYLRLADIYVSTALSDAGIASSTAEAMAVGLPVVITDFGDNREWVKHGESGFLTPLKSPKKLAEYIKLLARDKKMSREMGIYGRNVILRKNDWAVEMSKMEKECFILIKSHTTSKAKRLSEDMSH